MIKQEDLQKYVPQMASVHSTGMIETICRRKCCMAMDCGLRIHTMREVSRRRWRQSFRECQIRCSVAHMLMIQMDVFKTEQIRMNATTPLKVMETCYTYDSMERLTEEKFNGAVTSYDYDLAGNWITKSTDGRTIMMQKATGIPSSKRTRSQTLYIRVECSFTNWMKIKIRQGIMYLAMNISGWITTIT